MQKIEGFAKANEVLQAKIDEISVLSKTKQGDISTMIGGYNMKTGQRAVGLKMRNAIQGMCAEDIVVETLGGNKDDIIFTQAYRPRTQEFVDVCTRCQTKYSPEQFIQGTKFGTK